MKRSKLFGRAGTIQFLAAVMAGSLLTVAAARPAHAEADDAAEAPQAAQAPQAPEASDDLRVTSAAAMYHTNLDTVVFEQRLVGEAGGQVPTPAGQLDGAPVLAYVFPTSLPPSTVGFGPVDGILALAVTCHPDFDDTPLWDENTDGNYDNDGVVYHIHWVVLTKDERVGGGLSVIGYDADDPDAVLPPTNPGMPIYLDSPGFAVVCDGNVLRVVVPAYRIGHKLDFKFDAVTCYLQVNTSDDNLPMLGVYKVYQVLSGDLSLPYTVERAP